MRKLLLAIAGAAMLMAPLGALAQSVPNGGTISFGQVWTPAQWTTAWQSKQDYGAWGGCLSGMGLSPTIASGCTLSGDTFTSGAITASTIDSSVIGGTTPAAGKFSTLTDTGVTGSTQCLQVNSAGLISGFGASCGVAAGGTSGQILYNNSGASAGFTMNTDVTVVPSTGVATIHSVGGVTIGTAFVKNIGTSGGTLCLLNTTCVFGSAMVADVSATLTGLPAAYRSGSSIVATGGTGASSGLQSLSYGHSSYFGADRANGTVGSPSAVTSGNIVGHYDFGAWGSDSTLHTIATITSTAAAGTIGTSDASANLCINNIQSGTASLPATPVFCLNQAGYLALAYNVQGSPSPKYGTALEITGPDGVGTTLDMFAFDNAAGAYPGLQLELFGCTKASICAVPNNKYVGTVAFAAWNGTGDTDDAAVLAKTTEAQTPSHNGMDMEFWYTPNGSTSFTLGAALSPGGNGGFVIGSTTDLGAGTLDTAGQIATAGLQVVEPSFHLRGMWGGGAPTVSNGSLTSGSGDNAGELTGGSAVTSVTVTFNRGWSHRPFCTVIPEGNVAGTVYISPAPTTSSFTINSTSAYNGGYMYTCL